MKKFLKTTAKKSMALFMAVVMLMTCWVFIEPEKAEAYTEIGSVLNADQLESFKNFISASSVSTSITWINTGNKYFTDDSGSDYSAVFKNAIYAGTAKSQAGVTNQTLSDSGALESANIFYPYTVLVYDGSTTPTLPISVRFDSKKSCNVYHWGTWISSGAGGLGFVNSNWAGQADGSSNGKFLDAYTSDKTKGTTISVTAGNEQNYYKPDAGDWAYLANVLKYTGSLGTDYSTASYYVEISPEFKSRFSQAKNCNTWKGDKDVTLGTATKSVAVINIVPWKTAVEHAARQYLNILTNGENRYTATSVQNFKTYAAALFKVGPDEYFSNVTDDSGAATAVTSFASNNKTAVDNYYANGMLEEANYTVTFVNWDGTVLKTETDLGYGESATAPSDPTRAYDDQNHYTFSGWSGSYSNITGDVTVTAQYTPTAHTHTGAFSWDQHNGKHAAKCTGCASIGWNGTDGRWADCDGTWGGTDSSHTKPCSICGNTQTHTPNWVEVIDTKYQTWTGNLNPCLDDEVYYKSCSICGQAHSTATFIGKDAPGYHNYDTFTGHTNHTCTEDGYDTWLCSTCGQATEKRYDTVNGQPGTDPAAHNWNNKLAVYSDTQHGYQCRVEGCGAWNTDSLADHSYSAPSGSAIQTRPTCYQEGWGTYKCSCGHTYDGAIPATGNHTWNTNKLVEIDENVHGYRCRQAGCPAYQVADDGSEKHVWVLNSTITEPTCSADGLGKYKCSVCGAIKEEAIPADPDAHAYGEIKDLGDGTHGRVCAHNAAHTKDVASHEYTEESAEIRSHATCADAQTNWYGCKYCDANAKNDPAAANRYYTVGEALGHEKSNVIISTSASTHAYECVRYGKDGCTTVFDETDCQFKDYHSNGDGTHTGTCECGNTFTDNHTYEEYIDEANGYGKLLPTCSKEGYHYEKCAVCGDIKKVVDAIVLDAHSFGEIVDLRDGTHGRVCAYDASHTTDVDEHGYEKLVDADHPEVIATCVSKGSHYEKCSVCGNIKFVEDDIVPDNHDMAGAVSNGDGTHTANCKREGCTAGKVTQKCVDKNSDCVCDVCSYNIPHDYQNIVKAENIVFEADCNSYAVYHKSCAVCGHVSDETFEDVAAGYGAHEWDDTEKYLKSIAKCEIDAVYYYECLECGCSSETVDGSAWTKTGSALVHDYTGDIKDNGNGTHSYLCKNGCGTYGATVDCTYGDYTFDENNHYRECEYCGYVKETAHTMTTKWEQTPAGGQHTKHCTVCDYVLYVDCDYESAYTGPKCEQDAFTVFTCKLCAHEYTTVHSGTALVHDYTGDIVSNGDGTHSYYCANGCGTIGGLADCTLEYTQNADEKTHTAVCKDGCGYTYSENCSGGTAYCTEQAICEYCNEHYGVMLSNNHKTTTKYDAKDPTCEEDGYTAYEVCDACGEVLGKITLGAKGHSYTGKAVNLERGKHAYECKNGCGTTGVGKVTGATEDCFGGEATCTEDAYCAACNVAYEDALGHDFSADKDRVNQPEAGYHNYKCSRCDLCGIVEDGNQVIDGKIECYDAVPVRTGASCTEYAYYTHTCDDCGYVWVITGTTDEDAPLGHDYTSQKFLDSAHRVSYATCTESAVYWYDCSRCTKNAKDEEDTEKYQNLTYVYGDPLGHTFDGKVMIDEAILAVPASCTENAKYYVYCTVCKASSQGTDKEATFEYYGSMGGHNAVEVVKEEYLKSPATCTAKAVYYKSCTGCGTKSTQTFTYGDTLPHAFTEKVMDAAHIVTKANCQTAATYWYDCANCVYNAKLADQTGMTDEEIAALQYTDGDKNLNNHTNLTDIPVKNPTCDEEGHSAYKKCDGCNQEFGKTVYATTTHDFRGVAKYYDDDTHNFKCVNCEAYGNNGVKDAKVACSFGTWTPGKDENGKHIHTQKCSCGNSKTADCLDAQPTVVAPTCKADGYTSHTCDVCGNTWTTDPTNKTQHSVPDTWTSNGDGTHSRKCANCGEGETDYCSGGTATCKDKAVCDVCKTAYGELTGHTEGEWKDDPARPATCYANKWQITACTVCQTALEKEIPGSAFQQHDMDTDWVVTVAPTCAAEGEQVKRCQHKWTINGTEYQCEHTETMIIPAEKDSHVWSEWTVVGGDCSTGIKEKRECSVCHATETRTINDVEHDMKPYVIVNPTCEADGYIKVECQNCKYTSVITAADDESLKATGHAFEKNDTATTACVEVETCKNCGKNKSTAIGVDVPGAHKWVVFAGSQPTCSSDGYTDYYHCTGCGAEKGYETIEKLGHYDNNGDGKCDDCKGEFFGEGDSSKVCGCICHKTSGFMKFIYKIVRFFWKLFGISKTCDCGASHY